MSVRVSGCVSEAKQARQQVSTALQPPRVGSACDGFVRSCHFSLARHRYCCFELRVGTMCVCEQVGSHVSVEGSETKQARQRVSTLPY